MSDKPKVNSIDIHTAYAMMETETLTILDIRDLQSFQEAHIENAILLGRNELEEFLNDADKEKKLICYCYHGISSQDAAQFFLKKGFKEVYNIEGGFEAWRAVYPYHIGNQ